MLNYLIEKRQILIVFSIVIFHQIFDEIDLHKTTDIILVPIVAFVIPQVILSFGVWLSFKLCQTKRQRILTILLVPTHWSFVLFRLFMIYLFILIMDILIMNDPAQYFY